MRESVHFNLNLVEGSDIVNPLVTDVPNYESIDEQMFKNQNAGVQNATELKTGTVHAITRIVPDAQMITFTATSNFVAGDTFTVDGIQVSALTVSGEQLPTGAYVINSQVLAILKGTLLTVYGIGSEIADNALALNGHPDTYFGTKEEVNNAINTANSANELVNELNNSLGELKREKWYQQRIASNNVVNGVVDSNRRLLNEDGTLFSITNNANSTYKVTMVSRTGSSNTLYCSESIVDFSTSGVGIWIMSKTDSVYPYLSVTAENNIITAITPSNYSMNCYVTIEKLR